MTGWRPRSLGKQRESCLTRSVDSSVALKPSLSSWPSWIAIHRLPAIMLAALASLSLFVLSPLVAGSPEFEKKCLSFQPEKFVPGATRNVLQYVAANTTLSFPDNVASCNRGTQAVAANVCRVALSIKTSKQSNITFEAWLPENWSGRFLAAGNGGIDGCTYSVVGT